MTLPELVAFDLDGTFWKRKASGQLALRPYIEKIMKYLHTNGVDMAVCSNHDDEQEAKDFFKQTTIDIKSRKRTLMSLIKPGCFVIQSGNKNAHFQTVKKKSGVSYSDMLFFDDDPDNGNVEEDKGVNFIEVGQPGLDWETFKRGLKVYSDRFSVSSSSSSNSSSGGRTRNNSNDNSDRDSYGGGSNGGGGYDRGYVQPQRTFVSPADDQREWEDLFRVHEQALRSAGWR